MSAIYKMHYNQTERHLGLTKAVLNVLTRDMIIVCIGSDRSIYDALGPYTGTYLSQRMDFPFKVYGTLEETINATNIYAKRLEISKRHPNAKIIAVDATLTNLYDRLGQIQLSEGPINPGRGAGKSIDSVGNYSFTGVTIYKETEKHNETELIQPIRDKGDLENIKSNIRISTIIKMSEIIGESIYDAAIMYMKYNDRVLTETAPKMAKYSILKGEGLLEFETNGADIENLTGEPIRKTKWYLVSRENQKFMILEKYNKQTEATDVFFDQKLAGYTNRDF